MTRQEISLEAVRDAYRSFEENYKRNRGSIELLTCDVLEKLGLVIAERKEKEEASWMKDTQHLSNMYAVSREIGSLTKAMEHEKSVALSMVSDISLYCMRVESSSKKIKFYYDILGDVLSVLERKRSLQGRQ
jgi:hypothetical protein